MTQLFCVSVALYLIGLPFKSPAMKEILETLSISVCMITPSHRKDPLGNYLLL